MCELLKIRGWGYGRHGSATVLSSQELECSAVQ